MDELLRTAEQMIQAHADPETVRRYFQAKNQIMFGPLANPITRYQRANQDLRRQLDVVQKTVPHDLPSLVRAELVKIFAPFGQPPISGQDLCTWALETLHGHEIERRIEIERFRSNRPKFEAKIDRLRQAKPKSRKELPDLEQQQKQLRKCCAEVAHKRRQLKSVRIENQSIAAECDRRAHEANETARRLRLLSENKRKTQKTLSEQRNRKGELEATSKKVADEIQTRKMTQRFGPLAKSPVHKSKVELILSLRREVGELRRVGDELATKKKLMMIESVRDSQRFVMRPRTGINA
jgi:hypothetical protein